LKKIIAAVALLVLIVAAFSMLSTPSVRADDTSQAQILSYSWYIVPSTNLTTPTLVMNLGDLVVVGEVKNVSPDIIEGLLVTGFAYNSTGQVLDYASVTPFVFDMLPGQKAPFYLDFSPLNSVTGNQSWESSFTNITVSISAVSDTTETQYSGLTISSSRSTTDSTGTFNVNGNVKNNGTETVGDVWVDATFYNAAGTVIGVGITSYLTSSLAPGSSVAFTVSPYDSPLSTTVASYSLLIQSSPFTGSVTPSPSVTSSPQSSSSPTPSSGSAKYSTPTSSGLIYAIAVAVVIIAVVLVALLLLRKRHKNTQLEPPPPPPPPPLP